MTPLAPPIGRSSPPARSFAWRRSAVVVAAATAVLIAAVWLSEPALLAVDVRRYRPANGANERYMLSVQLTEPRQVIAWELGPNGLRRLLPVEDPRQRTAADSKPLPRGIHRIPAAESFDFAVTTPPPHAIAVCADSTATPERLLAIESVLRDATREFSAAELTARLATMQPEVRVVPFPGH